MDNKFNCKEEIEKLKMENKALDIFFENTSECLVLVDKDGLYNENETRLIWIFCVSGMRML